MYGDINISKYSTYCCMSFALYVDKNNTKFFFTVPLCYNYTTFLVKLSYALFVALWLGFFIIIALHLAAYCYIC